MMKPMKTTSYNILLKLSTQGVRNGSVQFTAILHLKRLFIFSLLGGTVFFDVNYPIVPLFPSLLERCYLRGGGSMVLHKRDCRQLFTELFQHDDALQQRDVVNNRAFRFQSK